MRKSADFALASGIVGATMQIGSGLMSLRGATQSLKASMEPLKLQGIGKNLTDLKTELAKMSPAELNTFKMTLDSANTRAEAMRQQWQSFGTLLQGGGQSSGELVDVDVDSQAGEQVVRAFACRAPVDAATARPRAARVTSRADVFRHRQVWQQVTLLVDGGDAEAPCMLRRSRRDGPAR